LYEHHHPPTTYLAAFLLPASLGPGFADAALPSDLLGLTLRYMV